ncbi:AAA family ATPase [Microbispora sp. NPDC049125]|uniref:AAA family ATPase n=1 Tax=Microbispora sp. NPDC049125 TaxID=3154929 RepID=UPI003464F415
MGQDLGRRFFIGLGTGRYLHLEDDEQLLWVSSDLTIMRDRFEDIGYQAVLPGLGQYTSAAQVKQTLSHWSDDVGLSENDIVVVYFAGHGIAEPYDRHHLLCWDTRVDDLAATGLPTEDLIRVLCNRRTGLRHLLVILDCCMGGAGSADAMMTALQSIARQHTGTASSGLWFLASARSKDEAVDGAFAAAFGSALASAAERTGQRQRYLDLTELLKAINDVFAGERLGQRAELASGLVSGLAPFLPNENYREDLPALGTDLEIQHRVAARDILEHFGPRSRGVEFESEQGLYFSGREKVLTGLVSWLTARQGDGRGRVVTGNPGCGKSAVLGRIVALSDPVYRTRLNLRDADPATIVPENLVTVAVHARHKRLEEIVAKIAPAVGIETDSPATLLQEFSRRDRNAPPVVIVVDALDEAGSGTLADSGGRGEPRRIAREFLRPLSEIHEVRLLIGTRRELVPSLGAGLVVLDLDSAAYRDDHDVAGYVRRVLLASDEPDVPTPYRAHPELARVVGDGVARRAAGVFLVARMTARSLRRQPAAVDVTRPGWTEELPSEIGEAFDDFLARFEADEARVRRVLVPLAFAEGQGMPRGQIWTLLATRLSGVECSDADVAETLTAASAYIAEVVDGGRSVYRLYHQSLAEHLRVSSGRQQEIQSLIVDGLVDAVPKVAGRRDWFGAHPYIRGHLPTHAAAAERLHHLIADAGFLLASDRLAMLRAMPTVEGNLQAQNIRSAYEQIAHQLTGERPLEMRAAELQLSARRCGADELAVSAGALGVPLPISARWAWWSATGAHRQLRGHTSDVLSVAVGDLDERPIVVTGSADGTARIWDLTTQQQIGKPLSGHKSVQAITVGDLADYTVALTADIDGAVHVWDLSAATELGPALRGHTNSVGAVAMATIGDRFVALTGSDDGTARLWDLESRRQIGPPLTAHRGAVHAVALSLLDGRPIAVTGGADRRVHAWDLDDMAHPSAEELSGHSGTVTAVAIGELDGRIVALSGDTLGHVNVWDLAARQQMGEPIAAHVDWRYGGVNTIALGVIDGRPVALTCGRNNARLWDLRSRRQRGHGLSGHSSQLTGAALDVRHDRPVAVTSGHDGSARIWDLTADRPSSGHNGVVRSSGVGVLNGRHVAITGSDDWTARLWDIRTRRELAPPLEGHTGPVGVVAVGEVDDRMVAATGGTDGTILLWNAATGTPLGEPLRGHTNTISAVALGRLGDVNVIVSGSDDGTVRVWDIGAGEPVGPPLEGHLGDVEHIVVAGEGDGGLTILVASSQACAYLWRIAGPRAVPEQLASLVPEDWPPRYELIGIGFARGRALALTVRHDDAVIARDVSTGAQVGAEFIDHDGANAGWLCEHDGRVIAAVASFSTVVFWDLDTGVPFGAAFHAGSGDIESVAIGALLDGPVAIVTTTSTVRVWDIMNSCPVDEPLSGRESLVMSLDVGWVAGKRVVVSLGGDFALRMHDADTGDQVAPHLLTGWGRRMSLLTGMRFQLAVLTSTEKVHVFDLSLRERTGVFTGHLDYVNVLWTGQLSDQLIAVTGDSGGTIYTWDVVTVARVAPAMTGHRGGVRALTVMERPVPLIVSGGDDGTVRIWKLASGEPVGNPLTGHVFAVDALAAGRVGDRDVLLSGDRDGITLLWDPETGARLDFPFIKHDGPIVSMSCAVISGMPVAAIADSLGLLRAWDLAGQCLLAEVDVGASVLEMVMGPDGRVFVATQMGMLALDLDMTATRDSKERS